VDMVLTWGESVRLVGRGDRSHFWVHMALEKHSEPDQCCYQCHEVGLALITVSALVANQS
jgi:hypothetical protein